MLRQLISDAGRAALKGPQVEPEETPSGRHPSDLPEQVSAVQSILSAAGSPLATQDVARAFKGKRASTVRPVLDALASIGMARRLKDGRYAA